MNSYKASDSWIKHFEAGERNYPSQGLIRILRGTYPDHQPIDLKQLMILDLGSGDGRNSEYLRTLGGKVYGVEISEEICDLSARLYPQVQFQVGDSGNIPFPESFFDVSVAWNSIYYMRDAGDRIVDYFRQMFRVTKSGGRAILSIPMPTNFIYESCSTLEKSVNYEQVEITQDPFGVRNGQIMTKFNDLIGLKNTLLEAGFKEILSGEEKGLWFGLQYDWWVLDCKR
jgi:SAM-dependent methyltransferase